MEQFNLEIISPEKSILIKNDTEFIDLIYKYYKYDILKKLKNHML